MNVAVLVRRKVNASVSNFKNSSGQGLIGKLIYLDGRETHVVEPSFNVMNDPRARSRLIGQVRQDERFVVSHLSSQFIPSIHPRLPNDELPNLAPQLLELVANVTLHCVFNAQCQHC